MSRSVQDSNELGPATSIGATSSDPRGRLHLAAIVVAAFAGLTSLTLSLGVFDGIPHVVDGISYSFQGKILASGRWYLPPPEPSTLFGFENILLDSERWCSIYPPGWPAVLALGWMVGSTWWINPLLLSLLVLGTYRLGCELFDARVGLFGCFLVAVSPFSLFMAAGYMAHIPTATALVGSGLGLAYGARTQETRCWILAGLLGGVAFACRPLTAVGVTLIPFSVLSLFPRRGSVQRILGLGLGLLGPLLLIAGLQYLTFGSATTSGYSLYAPDLDFFGFRGTFADNVALVGQRFGWFLRELSRSLWGLPTGDFILVLPTLMVLPFGVDSRAWRRTDLLLLFSSLALLATYSLYSYRDVTHAGPRFAFEAIAPIALLSARGALILYDHLRGTASTLGSRLLVYGFATVFLCGLVYYPLGRRLPAQIEYHQAWYHGQSGQILELINTQVGPRAVIFFAGPRSSYGSLMLENSLDPFAGDRVYLRDAPPLRSMLLKKAPRPEVWRVQLQLDRLPGVNHYTDRTRVRNLSMQRLK